MASTGNPENYLRKAHTVSQNKAALRRNVEMLGRFEEELTASVQAAVTGLTAYLKTMLEVLQAEKAQLAEAVEAAIGEAEACLSRGFSPETSLAKALWTRTPGELSVFAYVLNPPDIMSLLEVWSSYQNTLPKLCEQFCTKSIQLDTMPKPEIDPTQVHPMKAAIFSLFTTLPPLPAKVSQNKRIIRELQSVNSDQYSRCVVYSASEEEGGDLRAELLGPEDSPYAGFIFTLTVSIPENYPFEPYDIRFRTPVYHPNIIAGQRITMEHSPTLTLSTIFLMIGALMETPDECAVDEEIASEFRNDPIAFARKSRSLALKYARPMNWC